MRTSLLLISVIPLVLAGCGMQTVSPALRSATPVTAQAKTAPASDAKTTKGHISGRIGKNTISIDADSMRVRMHMSGVDFDGDVFANTVNGTVFPRSGSPFFMNIGGGFGNEWSGMIKDRSASARLFVNQLDGNVGFTRLSVMISSMSVSGQAGTQPISLMGDMGDPREVTPLVAALLVATYFVGQN